MFLFLLNHFLKYLYFDHKSVLFHQEIDLEKLMVQDLDHQKQVEVL